LKTLGRYLLNTLVVLTSLLLIAGIFAALRIALYEQRDDPAHLRDKQAYLHQIHKIAHSEPMKGPNIVFILYDDLGYGDFSFTGSKAIATPNIDALAHDGVVLNQFYSPAPICTPSRFGYLTGRFAERGGLPYVVFPEHHPATWIFKLQGGNTRIPSYEITMADILKAAGYRTGMVGKWHLGDYGPSRPNDMGFEQYFGALYSNDMKPFALYRNDLIAEPAPADQTLLSETYANEATAFIEQYKEEQFFLYIAHNFPHQPLHVRESRKGKSPGGLYGDVVQELDEGIGQLVASLKMAGVYDNTLIIISSDNGPWFQGRPGLVRGRKGDTFDGGMHVPFIAHWPEKLCRGCVLDGMAMGVDLVPTVLDLLNLPGPSDRVFDGVSILSMLEGRTTSPHDYLYYFSSDLLAVRDERVKYMPRRKIIYGGAIQGFGLAVPNGPWIFDLANDPDESYDASDHLPDDFARLRKVYESGARAMEGDPFGSKIRQ
jgi:arylsulfatase A-like enzyme